MSQSQSGWHRVRVDVPTPAILRQLESTDLSLLECIPRLGTTDVAVGPKDWATLQRGRFHYTTISALEDPTNYERRHPHFQPRVIDDYRLHYYNADQILAFFENLRAQYPFLISRQSIGTSINGETMWAYRFGQPISLNSAGPKSIVIEGLIHAREWITGASVMHIAKMIVNGLTTPQPTLFMGNQAVWIVPITNPDGYRYTWSTNRLWRKNRRHNSGGSFGVDINRNFETGFGGNDGSSGSQSSDVYRGTAAFSEPESQAIRTLMQTVNRFGGFMDYHSYSQLVLEPWGYTAIVPPDAAALDSIAQQVKSEMNQFGVTYTAGQTSHILYVASGTSNDYAYATWRAPAFGIELRDTGQFGFELPEDQIYATQDEVWFGFKRYLSLIGG